MKKPIYVFEVPGTTYNEGIPEGTYTLFPTLKMAKKHVEKHSIPSIFFPNYFCANIILKYDKANERYVRKIWIMKEDKTWFATRKVEKYSSLLDV